MAKTVFVTGGDGFIGRRVVARFVDAHWRVVSFGLPSDTRRMQSTSSVHLVEGDILNLDALERAAQGADAIVHLAGPVGQAGDYDGQWRVFVEGTRNVCRVAANLRSRLVVATSIAVYGEHIQHRICDEDVEHGPWAGAYGRAKQGQENAALSFASDHDLELTIIRPANVYGLGGGGAWGDKLLTSIEQTGGALFGDADTNNAGLVHVDNLADALFLATTHQTAQGQTFNVCDGEEISWARFMTDMAKMVGKPRPPQFPLDEVMPLVKANEDPAALVGPKDTSLPFLEGLNLVGFDNRIPAVRIRQKLGWRPKVSYRDAIASMSCKL